MKKLLFNLTPFLILLLFTACSKDDDKSDSGELSGLSGTITFAHAGDIYAYNLHDQTIDFLSEMKGRQGPFFSPDGLYFTTNNWPGNNEGVALWDLNTITIEKEFSLPTTLNQDEKGLKVASGAKYYSGIFNTSLYTNPSLVVMDAQAGTIFSLGEDAIRIKGHVWDRQENLYITGEILEGNDAGALFMARISNVANPEISIIRTFNSGFSELPDEMAVSHDGTKIGYSYQHNIWIGSTSGGATDHRVVFEAQQTLARPVFAPDGKYMAMAMLNSSTSLRGDIHVAAIPAEGSKTLTPEGSSKLPGPNSDINSTWTSGGDSSLGWF